MKKFLNIPIGNEGQKLYKINMQRISIAALFLSIFIPIILLINIVFLNQTLIRPEYNKFLCSILGVSVALLTVNYICGRIKGSRKYYKYIYRTYLSIVGLFMMLLSNSFFEKEHSLFYFFLSLSFFALVPILELKELICAELASWIFMGYLLVTNFDETAVASQILLFNILRIMITLWKYNYTVKKYRLACYRVNIKEKIEKDSLTGLANKTGLARRLDIVWPICTKNRLSCGMMMMELEAMDYVSRKYGYETEEECLKEIARNIKNTVRFRTDIVARVGKYKYAIFFQDIDKEDSMYVAKELRRIIRTTNIDCENGTISNLKVNIGIACTRNTKNVNAKQLQRNAEVSLKLAERSTDGNIAIGNRILLSGNRTVKTNDKVAKLLV